MLVPIKWLKDYVDIKDDIAKFSEKMIMSGSNIETVSQIGGGIKKVVVGRVVEIKKHPDADKLRVCMVDAGGEKLLQIVCGASNVREGALVPVALHGAKLPGGVSIKKGKLRGVESQGMLCSAQELGFEDKVLPLIHKDGIWLLEDEKDENPVGRDFCEAFELSDEVIDFEITPNRADCLSIHGIAREAAATMKTELSYPEQECREEGTGTAEEYIDIEVEAKDLCRRYVARIIQDIKIEQSPWWLQKRLMAAGMRPINNIVDITNFVMLELGQPMHAFDISDIAGSKIKVSLASKGEKFTTLDGKNREIPEGTLMIRDAEKAIAIAGIMGGLNSDIKEDSKVVLLESANFEPSAIRKASKKLGLRTESSGRFEKGLDSNLAAVAANRFCCLVEKLGAGRVVEGCIDVYEELYKSTETQIRPDIINKTLGTDIDKEKMRKILESLEIKVEDRGDVLAVTPPTIRPDLKIEADYTEEIARMYGYDKLPVSLPRSANQALIGKREAIRRKVREILSGIGAYEIQTYSFIGPSELDKIQIDEDGWERSCVRLLNPLGEENSVMRTLLTPGILETLSSNYNRNNKDILIYETGSVFVENIYAKNGLPEESDSLALGCYGKGKDFFFMKGVVEELLDNLGIDGVKFIAEPEYRIYHPGRCARIVSEKNGDSLEIGIMGELHPDVAENYELDNRVCCCEMFLDTIMLIAGTEKHYQPLPKFPAITRDIAVVVAEDVQAGELKSTICENADEKLKEVKIFDIYRGKQIDEGKKSVAFSLKYQNTEKTLTDEEVNPIHEGILEALSSKYDANLREI